LLIGRFSSRDEPVFRMLWTIAFVADWKMEWRDSSALVREMCRLPICQYNVKYNIKSVFLWSKYSPCFLPFPRGETVILINNLLCCEIYIDSIQKRNTQTCMHTVTRIIYSQVEGNVFAVYNMGTNDHPIGEVGVKVNDNQYHVVRFIRTGPNSTLQVDDYNLQSNHPAGESQFSRNTIVITNCSVVYRRLSSFRVR